MATHPTHAGASPRLIISWEELERIVGASNVQRIREARKPKRLLKAEDYARASGVIRGQIDMLRGSFLQHRPRW